MRLRRDRFVLDLSEHHGDGTPGSTVWVPISDVAAVHNELHATGYDRRHQWLRDYVRTAVLGGSTNPHQGNR
jgi:hypothetical protein